MFNNNEKHEFNRWRDYLDDALGSVWLGLDLLLVDLRDEKNPVQKEKYEDLLIKHALQTPSSDPEDWRYDVLSRRIYTVIYAHTGPDARKIMAECSTKNGLEGYRLLHKEHDPLNSVSQFQLMQNIQAVGRWSVKGLPQILQAVREVRATSPEVRDSHQSICR